MIDALTDEMTELYRIQEATDKKLETLLTLITNDPGNIQEVGRHLQACPRREEMDTLSESMKGWTERIEKLDRELQNFKEEVEDDDLVIQVKDNILKKLNENYEEIQLQIKELEKFKINHNNTSNVNSGLNVEKAKIKIPIRMFRCTDQERPVKFLNDLDRYITFMRIDSIESVQIVSQALDGIAKDWWYIHESDVRGYDQFKSLFKDRFWSSTIQRQMRRKVEFGTFYAGANWIE